MTKCTLFGLREDGEVLLKQLADLRFEPSVVKVAVLS